MNRITESIVMRIAVFFVFVSNVMSLISDHGDLSSMETVKSVVAIVLCLLYGYELYLIKRGKDITAVSYVVNIGFVLLAFVWDKLF
ncbi:MAG: hypothetical protein J6B91_05035 [Prevotella sp.]|nr:hypothetical protein [Prevotella sp.]